MSGGRLVVLDRLGRDVKQYPLPAGLATLGRDPACDIRVLLTSVSAHHATVVVHTNQTVVRNVSDGETLVNGRSVSVAALRHNDVITIGDRSLRWEYDSIAQKRPGEPAALPAVRRAGRPAAAAPARAAAAPARAPAAPARAPAAAARHSAGAGGALAARARHVQLALEMRHRASMPGSAGGKQVAIVQPQRRDTDDRSDKPPSPSSPRVRRAAAPRARARPASTAATATTPRPTTQATLWIEARKTSPRKPAACRQVPASLRLAALRRAAVALHLQHHAPRVTKIEAPAIDHTKQAAIMLMAGHTPRAKLFKGKRSPSYVVKKVSPGRKRSSARKSRANGVVVTPSRGSTFGKRRSSKRGSAGDAVSVIEITDSDTQSSTIRTSTASRRSKVSPLGSPLLPSPKKSSLKDSSKRGSRKTESIKFDLSNLENHHDSDVPMVTNTTQDGSSDENLTLHYSDASSTQSPSPRRSIHSRSSTILEKLGTPITVSRAPCNERSTLTPQSPRASKSARGSLLVQRALNTSQNTTGYSRRTTKSVSDQSWDTTVASAFQTRTPSPRSKRNIESYSIVDLVSIDSNESTKVASVYDSVGSTRSSSILFGTPNSGRKTRSTIDPTLLGSSTPYVGKTAARSTRSRSNPNVSKISPNKSTRTSAVSRRSKSLTTPENTQIRVSVNSPKISRASRSRSRINDSDLQLIDDDEESPKTSRRASKVSKSVASPNISQASSNVSRPSSRNSRKNLAVNTSLASPQNEGNLTPENRHSPVEIGTPVLSIQSLLNSSQSSLASHASLRKGKLSVNAKRKTIGALRSERKKIRSTIRSKSLNVSARKSLRLSKDSSDSDKTDENNADPDEEIVTPKSTVKLIQEAVKNKHSTAKKPQSKRSIIDDLHESDMVKQLFNSPVKRKLSQSMTEFSRKHLFIDDEVLRRPTRHTVALTGRSADNSLMDHSVQFSPDKFVSPLSTPSASPNLTGIKRLFKKNTPNNDLRNVKGVKKLLRTPGTRKSTRNDLTDVSAVKAVFAKSPKNDLCRVSGVNALFRSEKERRPPHNDLSDVRGVRKLYQRNSAENNLQNVSGVKKALRVNSPNNDLRDVRGVKRLFRQERQHHYDDVSGIEELFDESNVSKDDIFDRLVGKPTIKAVYSNSLTNKRDQKQYTRKVKSLQNSFNAITSNVQEWLEQELQTRVQKDHSVHETSHSKSKKSLNKSKSNKTRELQKLTTDTVEGTAPLRTSRIRTSTMAESSGRKKSASELYSAHTLPIKKRSLVEASLEKSNVEKHMLPIKKRAVVHSTPVKGRYDVTMNASELGRVSPIAVVGKTRNLETEAVNRSKQQTKESPKRRGRRVTKATPAAAVPEAEAAPPSPQPRGRRATKPKEQAVVEKPASPKQKSRRTTNKKIDKEMTPKAPRRTRNNTEKQEKEVQISPKRARTTRAKKDTKQSPEKKTEASPAAKSTRGRRNKAENTEVANTKKRRTSLVITKKPPVMSPKAAGKAEKSSIIQESPKKVVSTRRRKADVKEPPTTPKNTRAKVTKSSVIVTKPSPNLKPKGKQTRGKKADESLPKTKGRKVSEKSKDSSKKSPPAKRGRKNETVTTQVEEPKPKRGRKTVKKTEIAEAPAKGRTTRGKTVERPDTKKKVVAQESVQSVPTRTTRRAEAETTVIPETKSRKRKADDRTVIAPKVTKTEVTKTRGRKTVVELVETETPVGRQKRSTVKDNKVEITRSKKRDGEDVVQNKTTRVQKSTKVVEETVKRTAQETKPVRGKKPAAVESAPQPSGRKRRAAAASPAKAAPEKSRAAKAGGSPARRAARATRATRATRAKPAAEATARSRRR